MRQHELRMVLPLRHSNPAYNFLAHGALMGDRYAKVALGSLFVWAGVAGARRRYAAEGAATQYQLPDYGGFLFRGRHHGWWRDCLGHGAGCEREQPRVEPDWGWRYSGL